MNMKKNWKKLLSVLLLAALLCALPGTLAWGTDINAIQPDGPTGSQVVEGQTGEGQASGNQTDEGQTGGNQNGEGQTGGNQTDGTQTSGNQAGGDQASGTGSDSSTETGGTTTSGSTATGTPTDQSGSGSDTSTTPEATPTPTPTATPTPTPSKPVITKDPTDETVDVGGDCWFIAYSDAPYAVWHFVSPDGKTDYRYDAQEIAKAFPGLQIENGNRDSLHLVNIPAEMNGWRAGCEFRNDIGSVRSGYAVVHVNGAPAATPSPSPSATPSPSPSPSATPTPAATATAVPTSVPVATPSPVLSPAPEGTEEPPAALNRGGKIFLLFGAAALVVGAAAIGSILLVSKRMSAKEGYTYKNSTRRRK